MKNVISLGSIVEDWNGQQLMDTYVVSIIPLGNYLGDKYALISLNGRGLGNGYHNSLKELSESIQGTVWKVVNVNVSELILKSRSNN